MSMLSFAEMGVSCFAYEDDWDDGHDFDTRPLFIHD